PAADRGARDDALTPASAQPAGFEPRSRYSRGLTPCHRRNAWWNAVGSEWPRRYAISPEDSAVPAR
ncbi:MAG: hypothetical protein ABR610_14890, partial [Thermoanaerobaculia bacterium]